MKNIDKSTRLANYIIDFIVIYILWVVFSLFSYSYAIDYFIGYAIMFLYYFIFEVTTSQTLGKMVTKTKVVSRNGSKPHALRILIRSISRLIPLDAFSYVFGNELGMHDLFSNTLLTKA